MRRITVQFDCSQRQWEEIREKILYSRLPHKMISNYALHVEGEE